MLNQVINALLLMFSSTIIWSPLMSYGDLLQLPINPISFIIALAVVSITQDLADYRRSPDLRSLALGTLLLPVWLFVRSWAVTQKRG